MAQTERSDPVGLHRQERGIVKSLLAWALFGLTWAVFTVLALIFLSGCSSWHGTGVVTGKDYDAAWVQTRVTCHPTGKTTVCLPDTVYWPDDWELQIKDDTGEQHWIDVSEQTYENTNVGDRFTS
jgi:hypothetical protein